MNLLLIGNSHTYYNAMPATLAELLRATGEKARVTMLAQGGKDLLYHAASQNAAFNIRYGQYDTVILQDRVSGFDESAFRQGAAALTEMAREAGSAVLLYLPFSGRNDPAGQEKLTATYLAFCRERHVDVAPVGEAFAHLLRSVPPEKLYREDGQHATPYGSYIAALTLFYALTGRRRALSPDKFDDPGIALGFKPDECRTAHEEALLAVRLVCG